MLPYSSSPGRKLLMMSTTSPMTSTVTVRLLQPFHSRRMMPQRLLNVTFSAIRMQKAKVVRTGLSVRKPLPRLKPKN